MGPETSRQFATLHYISNPELLSKLSVNSRAGRYMKTHIKGTYKDTINI